MRPNGEKHGCGTRIRALDQGPELPVRSLRHPAGCGEVGYHTDEPARNRVGEPPMSDRSKRVETNVNVFRLRLAAVADGSVVFGWDYPGSTLLRVRILRVAAPGAARRRRGAGRRAGRRRAHPGTWPDRPVAGDLRRRHRFVPRPRRERRQLVALRRVRARRQRSLGALARRGRHAAVGAAGAGSAGVPAPLRPPSRCCRACRGDSSTATSYMSTDVRPYWPPGAGISRRMRSASSRSSCAVAEDDRWWRPRSRGRRASSRGRPRRSARSSKGWSRCPLWRRPRRGAEPRPGGR